MGVTFTLYGLPGMGLVFADFFEILGALLQDVVMLLFVFVLQAVLLLSYFLVC
jgi:hypothetical protein